MILRIILFGVTIVIAGAIIAYDCRTPNTNITAISLRDVEECPDVNSGYIEKKVQARVIQRKEIDHVHVRSCLISVTRIIYICGMFSHNSASHNHIKNYIQEVGRDGCEKMHKTGSYLGFPGHAITGIKPNSSMSVSLTLAGSLTIEGACEGAVYVESGISYNKAVVTATIDISVQDYSAMVKLDSNEIQLRNGLVCKYTEKFCLDTILGETYWEPNSLEECNRHVTVFMGKASLVRTTSKKSRQRYLVVEEGQHVFALQLKNEEMICNNKMIMTEHPKLMVILDRRTLMIESRKKKKADVDLTVYINSKFLYLEQSIRREIDKLHKYTVHRRCLLHREILRNRLLLAGILPNAVSMLIKNQRGYYGKVLGEVLYILKCSPLVVTVRKTEYCYNELPVRSSSNETFYMSPITHVLQTYAEQIECTRVAPPIYNLEGNWVGFAPYAVTGKAPQILKVDQEPELRFSPIQPLGHQGIYSQAELKTVQDALLFGMERTALNNIVARKVTGMDTNLQGTSTLNLFTKGEVKKIARTTMKHMWKYFENFGIITSGIIGIYVIVKTFKYIFSVIVNGISLHSAFGWNFALLASFFNALTVCMLQKGKRNEDNQNNSEKKKKKKSKKNNKTQEPEKVPEKEFKVYFSGPQEQSLYYNRQNIQLMETTEWA